MSIFQKLPQVTVDFSTTIGIPIFNNEGNKLGTLSDVYVDFEESYPEIFAIQVKKRKKLFSIYWQDIKTFSKQKIIVKESTKLNEGILCKKIIKPKINLLKETYQKENRNYPSLGKVILDKQIVDTSGKKVVRVNDIQFIKSGPFLRVTNVAVGLRSIIRRLGFEPLVDSIIKFFNKNSKYLNKESLINWKFVHTIPNKNAQQDVKLNLTNDQLNEIHPADLADILEDLDSFGRNEIFNNLGTHLAAETLSEIEPDYQAQLIKQKPPKKIAEIIENLGTDEAVDILKELEEEKVDEIISNLDDNEFQVDIHELLEYKPNVAGGLMTTEMFTVSPQNTKSQIIEKIKKNHEEYDTIYDIFIIDNKESLLGTCTLKDLLTQSDDDKIFSFMKKKDESMTFRPQTHWKEIAQHMSKYNMNNVPITNDKGHLLGLVTVDDILPWLLN